MHNLGADGIIKVNIYTVLAVLGGQAVADFVLQNLGNMFDREQLQNMYQQGIIGKRFLGTDYTKNTCNGQLQPKLNIVAETSRRDVWVATVKEQIKYYFDVFGYAKL